MVELMQDACSTSFSYLRRAIALAKGLSLKFDDILPLFPYIVHTGDDQADAFQPGISQMT